MEKIRVHNIVSVLEAPSVGFKQLANYWAYSAIAYAPKYYEYLADPQLDSLDQFFGDYIGSREYDNTEINHIYGFDKFTTPKAMMNKLVSAWICCYIENLTTSQNRPYDLAQSPIEMAKNIMDGDRKNQITTKHALANVDPRVFRAMQVEDEVKGLSRHEEVRDHAMEIAELMVSKTILSPAQLKGVYRVTDDIHPEKIAAGEVHPKDIFHINDDESWFDEDDCDDLMEMRSEDKQYEQFMKLYQSYFNASVMTGWVSTWNQDVQTFAYNLTESFKYLDKLQVKMGLNLPDPEKVYMKWAKARGYQQST